MVRVALASIFLLACTPDPDGTPLDLPGGGPGIGFDDLRYSSALGRVLVPGGRAGRLYLVDPDDENIEVVDGFGGADSFDGSHDVGPTSVDEGLDLLFVTDRTNKTLAIVDPQRLEIGSTTALGGSPDYVRFVEPTRELWVTQPGRDRLEIFALDDADPPRPTSVATIAVDNGPESIVVDATRGRAYVHRWEKTSVAIDLETREIVDEWDNHCSKSRGIALDEPGGLLFAACNEGGITVLDVDTGEIVDEHGGGEGMDVIGWAPDRRRLYASGGRCHCTLAYDVADDGTLTLVDEADAPGSTHCVTADDRGHAWVCDPDGGRLWRLDD